MNLNFWHFSCFILIKDIQIFKIFYLWLNSLKLLACRLVKETSELSIPIWSHTDQTVLSLCFQPFCQENSLTIIVTGV